MEFRTLNSVPLLPASVLGLGCARLGSVLTPSSGAGDHRLIDLALAEGVNFFDTANIYGQGDSERTLGRALRGRRDRVLIVSKGGQRFSPLGRATPLVKPLLRAAAAQLPALRRLIARVRRGHVGHSFDRRQLTRSLEESLRRLGTDYLDAYLLHGPPLSTIAREAVFDHLAGLKREGKIRSYGVSCDDADEALAALRAPGVTMIQVPVNVGTVEVIDRFLPAALARGVDVIAREPLMGGAALRTQDDRPRGEGPSPVRGAIRFVAGLPGVSVVLCGTTRPEHLRENVAALTAPCPDAAALARLRARFAAAGPPEPPEPPAAKAFTPLDPVRRAGRPS